MQHGPRRPAPHFSINSPLHCALLLRPLSEAGASRNCARHPAFVTTGSSESHSSPQSFLPSSLANHSFSLDGKNARTSRLGSHPNSLTAKLRAIRTSPLDLELGGELAGLPAGATRYITREDLLALPQVNQTVSDDPNLAGPGRSQASRWKNSPNDWPPRRSRTLVVAVCADRYLPTIRAPTSPRIIRCSSSRSMASHRNAGPRRPKATGCDMGPYMISHPKIHTQLQNPLARRRAANSLGRRAARISRRKSRLRCDCPARPASPGATRRLKPATASPNKIVSAATTWAPKAARKQAVHGSCCPHGPRLRPNISPPTCAIPKSKNPTRKCPANPAYDDATLQRLTAYFQTFSAPEKP